MSNRGYAGFYNGNFLRSSYEFVFANILEFDGTSYTYEEESFDLGFKIYKPDFFLYEDGNLKKVVEVKSTIKKEIEIASKELVALKEIYGIDGVLISYKGLSKLCRERGLKITVLMRDWINSEHTTINKSYSGKINPHYNLKHSDESKKLIGASTRGRWARTPEVYLEASKKGALRAKKLFTGQERVERFQKRCPVCDKRFLVIKSTNKECCSTRCSNTLKSHKGAKVVYDNAKIVRNEIKAYTLEWALNNRELILETPYNKITTNLKILFDDIEDKFGIKDLRIISRAMFGKDKGRKELLRYLKEYVQTD